jgi:hypothetical protein
MKIASLALAAVLVTASAAPSLAGGRHHDNSGDVLAGAAVGVLGGLLLGQALSGPSYAEPVYVAPAPVYVAPPPRVVYRPAPVPVYDEPVYVGPYDSPSDEHAAWCASRYRSYDVVDDTWVDRTGRVRACISPFN